MSDNGTDIEKIVERVRKLLALAKNNPNEAEAASAAAKAQELLEAYNLEMSDTHKDARGPQRSDRRKDGGLYKWQRNIWNGVARLNFCHYISIRGLSAGSQYEHRVIGSHANVLTTELMAQYLQDTVEQLAQRWANDNRLKSVFVREAIAYREGMADRISNKLWERRNKILEEEQTRIREEAAQRHARNEADPGTSALTLVEIISTEADFNNDYLNGWELGTTAKNRHDSEIRWKAYQAEQEKKRAAYEEWAKLHPEEAARLEAKALREELEREARDAKRRSKFRSVRSRKLTPEEERARLPSYDEGYDKGREVGIDRQVNETKQERIG
jgi:hypothetical protein